MLDKILAYHCSPALAGIKPSNIVTCHKDKFPDVKEQIVELNAKLNQRDIYIEVLCECPKHILLIVYQRDKLIEQLSDKDIQAFLKEYGYKPNGSLEEYLNKLRDNLHCDHFPHEIGCFLGYPLHDINGFINYKGQDCLYVGPWKVYADVENAKKTFRKYKDCTDTIFKRVASGMSITQIFCAA